MKLIQLFGATALATMPAAALLAQDAAEVPPCENCSDTMTLVSWGGAYQAMREIWHGRNDVHDLRVAAYIVSISRVAATYVSKGL